MNRSFFTKGLSHSAKLAGAVQHLHHQLVVPVVPRQLVHGGEPLELDQTSSRHRSHGATVHIGTVVWRWREMVKQCTLV